MTGAPAVRKVALAATAILIVASCRGSASAPADTLSDLPPTAPAAVATPVATPVAGTVGASPVASFAPSPVASASASSRPTLRLGDVVAAVDLVSPGTGWAATSRGLLVTNDDGSSWSNATPTGDVKTIGLDALDRRTAFVASARSDGSETTISIWRTSDGGGTWHEAKLASVPTPDNAPDGCGCASLTVAIDAVDSAVAFADIVETSGTDSESHEIFRTSDGGVTWTALPFAIRAHGAPADLAISFLTLDIGAIVFDGRTFTTRTGWGDWTEYPEPLFGPVTNHTARHWVMGLTDPAAGSVKVADSTDAGATWSTYRRPIPATTNVSLDFVSATTWIATIETSSGPSMANLGPAETWRTEDAGTTWTPVGKLPTSDIQGSQFVDPEHGWVLASPGRLATTSDGGATWSTILGEPEPGADR